jgi:hypothetical protein
MLESEAHTERGSPSLVGRGIAKPYPQSFESYLKVHKKRNIKQILCYAQRYRDVLDSNDATALLTIQSGALRRHAMEALACLSKYNGCYDRWQEIRKRYSLHWTDGNESLNAMARFFNPNLSLESISHRIRKMIRLAPTPISNIIKFACLVGLRPSEVIESIKLINNSESVAIYYNSSNNPR